MEKTTRMKIVVMLLFAVVISFASANTSEATISGVPITERDLVISKPTVIVDNTEDILSMSCSSAFAKIRLIQKEGVESNDHVAWDVQTELVNGVKKCVLIEIVKKDKPQEKADLFMIAVENAIESDEEVPSDFKSSYYSSKRTVRMLKKWIRDFDVAEQYPAVEGTVSLREALYQYSLLKQN